jgi:hypothetical protein
MIRIEETFLAAYVTIGGQPGLAGVNVVESTQSFLEERIAAGELFICERPGPWPWCCPCPWW